MTWRKGSSDMVGVKCKCSTWFRLTSLNKGKAKNLIRMLWNITNSVPMTQILLCILESSLYQDFLWTLADGAHMVACCTGTIPEVPIKRFKQQIYSKLNPLFFKLVNFTKIYRKCQGRVFILWKAVCITALYARVSNVSATFIFSSEGFPPLYTCRSESRYSYHLLIF